MDSCVYARDRFSAVPAPEHYDLPLYGTLPGSNLDHYQNVTEPTSTLNTELYARRDNFLQIQPSRKPCEKLEISGTRERRMCF